MPLFDRDGRRIAYLDTGGPVSVHHRGGARLRTLLLLHAFPLHSRMWEPQLTAVPAGWRFVAPDFCGFGESDGDADARSVSIEDYARDALALLDHLRIDHAVVGGLSMGGYVAFALWRLAVSRVAGLVLADTKAEADGPEARKGRLEMVTLLDDSGVESVIDRMVPRLLGERTRRDSPGVEAVVRRIAGANSPTGLRTALLRMMERPDSSALLPRIVCPSLVIVGDQDMPTPPQQARAMHAGIRGSSIVEIRGAGHLSNLEQPEAFNEALRDYLASL